MEPIHLMKASTQTKSQYGIFEYGKLDDIFSQITLISYLFRIWAPLLSNDSLNKDWTPQATIFASLIRKLLKTNLVCFLRSRWSNEPRCQWGRYCSPIKSGMAGWCVPNRQCVLCLTLVPSWLTHFKWQTMVPGT